MMPNEEWGLIGKVAIVTGGGAAEDGIGMVGQPPSCWLALERMSWSSTAI